MSDRKYIRKIVTTCSVTAIALGIGIYAHCLYLSWKTPFISARVLTIFLLVLSAPFWVWHQWKETGLLFNWLTIACAAWVGLVVLGSWLAQLDAPEIL